MLPLQLVMLRISLSNSTRPTKRLYKEFNYEFLRSKSVQGKSGLLQKEKDTDEEIMKMLGFLLNTGRGSLVIACYKEFWHLKVYFSFLLAGGSCIQNKYSTTHLPTNALGQLLTSNEHR